MSSSSICPQLLFLLAAIHSLLPGLLTAPNYVNHLPGFSGSFPSRFETGYVTVDGTKGEEMFYYFIESEKDPSKDPVLLWLTGGPGCTSFFGLANDIGPMRFKVVQYDGTLPSLVYNPYTWTKISNIIFLDWPTGSGFSFSRTKPDVMLDDIMSLMQIYRFLQKWFLEHQHFLSNPFYVAGDSFGGKMATLVAHRVAQGVELEEQPSINLKGYLVGNPRTGSNLFDLSSRIPYAHARGIISDQMFESIQRDCAREDYWHTKNALCAAKFKAFDVCIDEVSIDNLLKPKCRTEKIRAKQMREARRSLWEANIFKLQQLPEVPDDIECSGYPVYLSYFWANNNLTRKSLGVKEGTVEEWQMCNERLKDYYTETVIPSSLPHHYDLITRGYRALVFSGDQDLTIPFIGTKKWIKSFNLSAVDRWRSWHIKGHVVGYTESYQRNLTFATVMEAGHVASRDKPEGCFAMFKRWIMNKPI